MGSDAEEADMSSTNVATTILAQMGGRVGAMLGATSIVNLGDGVSIRWPNRQRSKGNVVEIKLKGDDTYRMEFINFSMRGGRKPVQTFDGVYADQLIPLFEGQTGWYLTL